MRNRQLDIAPPNRHNAVMAITKKVHKATKEALANMNDTERRHYQVWLYQYKHNCSLSDAYLAIYKCKPSAAPAAASRLAASPEWKALSTRVKEAALHSKESIRIEITAAMLDILNNPHADPTAKTKAASILASTYDLTTHNVNIKVDAVAQYVSEVTKAAAKQPLIDDDNADPETIDV